MKKFPVPFINKNLSLQMAGWMWILCVLYKFSCKMNQDTNETR